jgi:thiamine kinase-like enzyme
MEFDIAALAAAVPQWAGRTVDIEPLGGGITNRNYVATVDGHRYVLRLPGERTELLGIDRAGEAQAAQRMGDLGIGPPVAGELPGIGTLITELVPGGHLQGAEFTTRLDGVVDLVRRLHASGPLDASFMIHRIVEAHGRDAAAHGVAPPSNLDDLLTESARIEAAFDAAPQPPLPCHNDLLPANVLFDDKRVWLLDFEYAGMNERFFDLGNLSVNAALDAVADEQLLRRYLGGTPNDSAWARLQLMKIMSEFREGMWAVVQQAISTLDTDFVTYAEERLGNCHRLVDSSDYEDWLRAARQPAR